MARIIDLRTSDGDLVILGKSLVLPNSIEDSNPVPLNGSLRFNSTLGTIQYYYAGSWASLTSTTGSSDNNHTHSIAQIFGLQTALNGKAALSHVHAPSEVTGLVTALNDKAPITHAHSIADVSGLSDTLADKSDVGHTHTFPMRQTISVCFPESPPEGHTLVWTAATDVDFNANFAGSAGRVLTNPQIPFVIAVKKNGTVNFGSITVGIGGGFSFTTVSSEPAVEAGETLSFITPTKDLAIRHISFTIVGNSDEGVTSGEGEGGGGEQGPPGVQGPAGEEGDPGPGIAAGGTTKQYLAKASNADADTQWVSRRYNPSFFFTNTPAPDEVLFVHLVPEDFVMADNFSGSMGFTEVFPAAPFVMRVFVNNVVVGTISVSVTGTFTFVTSGAALNLVSGDRIKVMAPTDPDIAIQNCAVTFLGTV